MSRSRWSLSVKIACMFPACSNSKTFLGNSRHVCNDRLAQSVFWCFPAGSISRWTLQSIPLGWYVKASDHNEHIILKHLKRFKWRLYVEDNVLKWWWYEVKLRALGETQQYRCRIWGSRRFANTIARPPVGSLDLLWVAFLEPHV